MNARVSIASPPRTLVLALAVVLASAAASAQSSATPPVPEPAVWWGEVWGTVEMNPKVVRPGDAVTVVATTWNGGASGPGWACGGGWRVVGTSRVAVSRFASCFDLVDYEPKASEYLKVSVGSGEVAWEGLPGPPPTDNVDRYYSYVYNSECYCWVGWSGSSGRTAGCPLPIATFRRGQTFKLYLKAKNSPSCSTNGKYTRVTKDWNGAARFDGWNGVGWSNAAELYYRFDYNATNTPVPVIDVTAEPASVPVGQTATVRAAVTDATTGAPMPGQTVTFKTTVGLLGAPTAMTDASGVATVEVKDDGQAGTAVVTGTIPQGADSATVEFSAPPGGGGGGGGTPGDPGDPAPPVLRQYFAEGATGSLFTTDLALANPGEVPARATLKFLTEAGASLEQQVTVPPRARKSVRLNTDVPGLGATGVATVVESTVPLVADRTMTWDGTGYGSHTETSVAEPRPTWYLAEGATHSGFQLFYLIQNAAEAATDVEIKYLRPAPLPPITRRETIGPRTRRTIWVNHEAPGLASTDVSAVVTSSLPVVVERAMYLNAGGRLYAAGHESAGVAEPQARWFFAEGATGPYFDLFILVANPDTRPARVRATFLLPGGGTSETSFTVEPESRRTLWVDVEGGPAVADTAVSTVIESLDGVPVIAERAMWWPGTPSPAAWHEAHNAPGSTRTAARWALADCEVGGPRGVDTYLLVANTGAQAVTVKVSLLFEDGTTEARQFAVAARSRFNVHVATEFPVATGRRFAATVEAVGEAPGELVVERAVYGNAGGVHWAAGANALGAPLVVR